MSDRIIQIVSDRWDALGQAAIFALTGIIFTVGQMLNSQEQLTIRIVIGRCLSTAGLSMAAGLVLLFFPTAPFIAQIGVAAALGALGTSVLEKLIQKVLGVNRRS